MRFLQCSIVERYRFCVFTGYRFLTISTQKSVTDSTSGSNVTNLNVKDPLKVKKPKNATTKAKKQSVPEEFFTPPDLSDAQEKSVVLRKPIPKNFIRETLLPHLEHNVAYNCMKFPPDVVLQIGIAYSKLPHFIRQRSIEDALVEAFRFRMTDYSAPDCIQLLNTCLTLQGLRCLAVYDDIVTRLEVPYIFNSINSLNRLGICSSVSRILKHSQMITDSDITTSTEYTNGENSDNNPNSNTETSGNPGEKPENLSERNFVKLNMYNDNYNDKYHVSLIRPWSYIVKGYRDRKIASLVERLLNFCEERILPQLEYDLKSFDADELTDLLGVLAQRSERDGATLDFPIISILMSNIIRLYPSTSLLNSLSNLSSLCRLRIRHDKFLSLVLEDLRNPLKVTNIYHKHLSRCVWSLARFDLLNDVLSDLMPHISRNVPKFEPSCFARLAQVSRFYTFKDEKTHKEFNNQLMKITLFLLTKLDAFSPKELTFFIAGLFCMRLLPDEKTFTARTPSEIKPKFEKDERYLTKANKSSNSLIVLSKVLEALRRLDSEFDLLEIERLISTTRSFEEYEYLLQKFPESWANIINPPEDMN
ncbi:hypothetical protein TpMuguga_04g00619 [Theileria parva strain Muguga]|uniref:Uncharacterized protein n=1 Tax=Theileria parva TaxID=5875 RepID=Q4N1V8_THEPA|nr:uncharacterized protein TpMuguga_04g00619 [Theileria parva strain Muguga]EAN31971.1 hypothetical protein TpMuguga_04g00619 [Theileria parva strain Muguga]|eukprot:XP_764254.1 hypothetical protein [Theileria parva strain Muguga]